MLARIWLFSLFLKNFSHFNSCVVIAHCSFNLPFPSGQIVSLMSKLGCFSLLSFESSLYILDISLLLDMWLAQIFYPSTACLFILLTGIFYRGKKVLNFHVVHLIIVFSFLIVLLVSCLWTVHLVLGLKDFLSPVFSSKSFIDYVLQGNHIFTLQLLIKHWYW